ncbi:nicotinate phosphoribosyltransferase [Egretta garzetta]|uniref:nicotinate phosphoribosyltransferase n=1 Tax=Egretta garzetta TaxID=188379 RepID=UPI00163C05EE|nr:nicotinate phosphoribosyltransferase [Egretta garzetta]
MEAGAVSSRGRTAAASRCRSPRSGRKSRSANAERRGKCRGVALPTPDEAIAVPSPALRNGHMRMTPVPAFLAVRGALCPILTSATRLQRGEGGHPPWCPLSSVPADVAYLRSVLPSTTEDAFFDYLATLDASEVTVSAVPEGSVVFARVPFLQVKGPLLVVQLLETTLLCLVSYASLVATNATRFRLLAGPDVKLMEMGLRRAQGPDGALSASKYSYIGGFDCTSNILAGKLYGIPVRGTIAHSFIMSFTSLDEVQPRLLQTPPEKANQGELAAFVSYAITFPRDFQGLLDTYCVRSFQVPWVWDLPIAVSNDISEQSLEEFSREGAEIDTIGVGTNLVTCPLQPSLGCVYKLVEVNGSPCLKLTEEEEKVTIPGTKTIYRLYDTAGHPFMDLMALEEEPSPSAGQELAVHVLGQLGEASKVMPTTVEPLNRMYFRDGQVRGARGSLPEGRSHAQASLSLLHPAHRRLHEPQPYPVAMTERLHRLLAELRQASQ